MKPPTDPSNKLRLRWTIETNLSGYKTNLSVCFHQPAIQFEKWNFQFFSNHPNHPNESSKSCKIIQIIQINLPNPCCLPPFFQSVSKKPVIFRKKKQSPRSPKPRPALVPLNLAGVVKDQSAWIWFTVSTPLKNMLVKWGIFLNIRGENEKYLKNSWMINILPPFTNKSWAPRTRLDNWWSMVPWRLHLLPMEEPSRWNVNDLNFLVLFWGSSLWRILDLEIFFEKEKYTSEHQL